MSSPEEEPTTETEEARAEHKVEVLPIDAIKLDEKNAREHPDENKASIRRSLDRFGAGRSGVIDGNNVVRAGNGTVEQAREAGFKEVLVVEPAPGQLVMVRKPEWTDAQAVGYGIMDNRSTDQSHFNPKILIEQVEVAIEELDLGDLGFTDIQLQDIRTEAGLPDPDGEGGGGGDPGSEVQKLPPAVSHIGDLITLGQHRILCGDTRKESDLKTLMGDDIAHLVYTDPPYGVDYDGGTVKREKLAGDGSTDLYSPACAAAAQWSDKRAALYLWHAGVKGIAAAAAAAAGAAGYEIRCEIVWNKNQAQFGALSAQYKQKHEPAYYCFKKGNSPRWFGPKNEVTVWDCDRASKNQYHPTQKPVALAERAIRNSSEPGQLVLDLFLGSGATLIAADKMERVCYGCELEPAYVDVAVRRYVQHCRELERDPQVEGWRGNVDEVA